MLPTLLVAFITQATPASELRAAVADLRANVRPTDWQTTRYLSLYALQSKAGEATAVVSFVLNTLSRADRIVVPQRVAGGRLIRIDLKRLAPRKVDLRAFTRTWEALAADDPYWHLKTEVLVPVVASTSRNRSRNRSQRGPLKPARTKTVYTDGGWVGLDQAAALRQMTGSGAALLRADWFISKATVPPFYYAFAGIPETEAGFYALVGVDLKAIKRLRADEGANLFFSGVTRKPRRLVRRQGPLGAAWQTFDIIKVTPERDPFRNPFAFKFDAGEYIATKRNGLHYFALYDANGKRQDDVPPEIARDDSDPQAHDSRLVPMLSCVRCHVEDGLRPFANDQRRLLAGAVKLYADSPDAADRLASFYDSDLGKRMRRDQEDYRDAVAKATAGMKVPDVAAALAKLVRDFQYALVTPAQAARELGLQEADLKRILGGSHDPIVLAL